MLVGREQELNVLNIAFRAMLEGKGNILFLAGEAGLGKTTLVHEWWKTVVLDTADSYLYAETACSIPIGNVDVGKLEALQPWADIVAQLQGHEEQSKKKLDFKKLIFDSAPAWAWALPIVGGIAHGAMETARLVKEQQSDHNPNASNQQQVFQQYVNLLTKIADETPLVILLDDMHWADTSSTNLLFYLSRQITSKKILVLATYRPDDAAISHNGKGHPILSVKNEMLRYESGKELTLGYLGSEAIRELLEYEFGTYHADERFEEWLWKISDGNSLFVTQFIKTLHEDGQLDMHGAFVGDYDAVTIPSSALAVVTERTRRLDNETRELLSYATAEGEEFTSYVLGQLTSKKPLELLRDLRKAEAVGFVQSKKGTRQFANQTTSVFGFSHALFHKALYDGLLPEEREILHRQCYEILKTEWDRLSTANDHTNSLASKLLTHAEKCGKIETAADVAFETAKGAWQHYSEPEAMEMLAHVKRLAENKETSLLEKKRNELLGETLYLQSQIDELRGRYEDAMRAVKDALAHIETLNDDKKVAQVLIQQAIILFRQSDYHGSEDIARIALSLAGKIDDKKGEAQALNRIGNACYSLGAHQKSLEYFTRSLEIRKSIGDQVGVAGTLNNIGTVYKDLFDYEKALAYYTQGLEIAEQFGARQNYAIILDNIGNAYKDLFAYEKALEYCMRSLEIHESIGDRAGIARVLNVIGLVHLNSGAFETALDYLTRSLAIAESIGNRAGSAAAIGSIGRVREYLGDYEKAVECLTRSLEIFESIGHRHNIAWALNMIGSVHNSLGAWKMALEYYARSLEMREVTDDHAGIAITLNNIGNVHYSQGAYERALKYYVRSLEIAESIGARDSIIWGRVGAGATCRRQGNMVEARNYLTRGLSVAEEIKRKELIAVCYCEFGLVSAEEAVQSEGEEKSMKLNEAIMQLEKGLGLYHEMKINNKEVQGYEKELYKLKTENVGW